MDDIDASLYWAGALPNSRSPMVANGGTMMEPACASEFRSLWSISLTFKTFNEFRSHAQGTFIGWPYLPHVQYWAYDNW
jgi:hypothetical protein